MVPKYSAEFFLYGSTYPEVEAPRENGFRCFNASTLVGGSPAVDRGLRLHRSRLCQVCEWTGSLCCVASGSRRSSATPDGVGDDWIRAHRRSRRFPWRVRPTDQSSADCDSSGRSHHRASAVRVQFDQASRRDGSPPSIPSAGLRTGPALHCGAGTIGSRRLWPARRRSVASAFRPTRAGGASMMPIVGVDRLFEAQLIVADLEGSIAC